MQSHHAITTIAVNDLRVAYEDCVALTCKNADIKGNIIAVVGHNGAGKSTFIKTILGLLRPASGSLAVTFKNSSEEYPLSADRHMAFCPETGSVFADISVEAYIKLWCRIKHRDGKCSRKRGARYIELLQIEPLPQKRGRELSKGQRRRVQTAIGFLIDPKLFLFDEPFDGLDVLKTHELTELISEEASRMSFIVSSHRMDVVERLADYLVVLKNGEFLSFGSVEEVCLDLAGETVLVTSPSAYESTLELLHARFNTSLVSRVGSQISLTGKEIDPVAVRSVLASQGFVDIHIESAKPSLVDAMNYHLKLL